MSESNDHGNTSDNGNNDNENNGNNMNNYFYDNGEQYDLSNNPIVHFTLNETEVSESVTLINKQGTNKSGDEITNSVMFTNDPSENVHITENLIGVVETYNDLSNNSNTSHLLNRIKGYAAEIQCSDFQGKGTIEDYTGLFQAAAHIANESKQMQLDIDVEGFSEFGKAADDLSALFTSFIVKLENVSIIDDTNFLTSICSALEKICNLSNVFGKFKQTILATSKIELPKSAHEARVAIENVMDEVNCAMGYINYFVNGPAPGEEPLETAELDQEDQDVINTAIATINNWNILCEEGVSIALTKNEDVQYIHNANASLQSTTVALKNATNSLKAKLSLYNIR
jgi:hypothetical protein